MTTYVTGLFDLTPREQRFLSCLTCSAGFPSPAENYSETRVDLYDYLVKNPASTFFMRVAGESMRGSCIHPGDILVVDRSLTPQDQDVVIAVVEGELIVKRLRISDQVMALMSEGLHSTIQVIEPDTPFEIWGVVTAGILKITTRIVGQDPQICHKERIRIPYLMQSRIGVDAPATFIRKISTGALHVFDLKPEHGPRIEELLQKYRDLLMDLTDASLVILAEHLGHGRILSVDQRDFRTYRWKNTYPFENLYVSV